MKESGAKEKQMKGNWETALVRGVRGVRVALVLCVVSGVRCGYGESGHTYEEGRLEQLIGFIYGCAVS